MGRRQFTRFATRTNPEYAPNGEGAALFAADAYSNNITCTKIKINQDTLTGVSVPALVNRAKEHPRLRTLSGRRPARGRQLVDRKCLDAGNRPDTCAQTRQGRVREANRGMTGRRLPSGSVGTPSDERGETSDESSH